MTAGTRALAGYLAGAALLVFAIVFLGRQAELHFQALQAWIASLGPWGLVAFVVALALGTSLLLPESIFGVAAGVLFGLTWGVVASLAGNLLAASLQYALSHRLLRRRIQRMLASRPSLAGMQRAVLKEELRLQVLVRLTPLNTATTSYLFGAAGVRFRGFLLACFAHLPHLVLEVYLGHAGKHVALMAVGTKGAPPHELVILAVLASLIVAVVLISRIAYRALQQVIAETADS